MAPPPPLELLYADAHMVVVNKPSGISVHKGQDRSDDNVLARLRRQLQRYVWLPHRLDRGTSGALVFALDEESARAIATSFMEGRVAKTYLAWTRGAPSPLDGVIDYAVPKSEDAEERVEARTQYTTVAIADDPRTRAPRYGLVRCHPETGRYHQIRRHLKHVRCPILGDTTYGDNKENRALREHAGLTRLALHALALRLAHPIEPERMLHVVAPLPADLREPLTRYGVEAEVLARLEREA